MPATEPDPRPAWRPLRGTLIVGALYDFAFAAVFLAAPEVVAVSLAVPLPGERFYLWLVAVLLAMVGATYLVAARDPRHYRPLVAIAIAGRAAGFVALALAAMSRPDLAGLWQPAAGDLLFALAHLATGWRLWR